MDIPCVVEASVESVGPLFYIYRALPVILV